MGNISNITNISPLQDPEIFKLLIENVSDLLWIYNINWQCYTYCSPSIYEMTGFTVEEGLRKSLDELHPNHSVSIKRSLSMLSVNFDPKAAPPKDFYFQVQLACKDGSLKWVGVNAKAHLNKSGEIEILGVTRDIDKHKKNEMALRVSEEKLRSLFLVVNVGVTLLDRDGLYIDFNDWWCEFLGFTREEMNKITIWDVTYIEDRDSTDDNFKMLINGEIEGYRQAKRYYTKDGQIKWGDLSASPVRNEDGEIIRAVGIVKDITDSKKNEEALKELNATKDKFFSIISHDLRSPFSAFLGMSDILAQDISDMSAKDIEYTAKAMNDSAKRLYLLLNDLLEWSKMQQGLIDYNPASLYAAEGIASAVVAHLHTARKKNVSLTYDVPHELFILADNYMFETIMRNLISNAIKFTRRGGKVTVTASTEENMIRISVADTGIGMEPAILNNLFSLTAKTGRAGTEGEDSSGLGLLLIKDFIAKHGGTITVQSEVNKGTVFCFTVPVAQP